MHYPRMLQRKLAIFLSFALLSSFVPDLSPPVLAGTGSGPFTPGDGGPLPAFTEFTPQANVVGGLYIEKNHRDNASGGGTEAEIELSFPTPENLYSTSYTLQYSDDGGSTWNDYLNASNQPLSTTGDNFSINPDGSYSYRLTLVGGLNNGYTSNIVQAPLSNIDTFFTGWSLNENMTNSGVMTPNVGNRKIASFSLDTIPTGTGTDLTQYLTYQWYRVNPATYEKTLISGATGTGYTTVTEDAGYYLMVQASGDDVNVGGFSQVLTDEQVVFPNKAYVENVQPNGFRLNFYHTLSGTLATDDLELSYYDNGQQFVTVDDVTHLSGNAVYDVTATFPNGVTQLDLRNNADHWRLGEEMQDFTPVVTVSLSTGSTATGAYAQGDVIITEFMPNPAAVTDANGEWIELYNNTSEVIDLNGWTLSDNFGETHTIDQSLTIAGSGYIVLARNGSGATNGGLSAEYVYNTIDLTNNDDEIILTQSGGGVIDMVEYNTASGWTIPSGASLALLDYAGDHNDPNNWTGSVLPYGDGDFGTPAAAHSTSAPDGDGDGVPADQDCDDNDEDNFPGNTEVLDGQDNNCDGLVDEGVCANGVQDPGEECDDGNTQNGDGCNAICLLPACGNSYVDSGETCDDGNTENGDGCNAGCHFETYDFGDAPDSYGTLLASNGARHIYGPTSQLGDGMSQDDETDGQPTPGADGDDNTEQDDDDGVTFSGALVTGASVDLLVAASGETKLNAWIDYDQNGTFDSVEQIFTDQNLSTGINNLNITIPADATAGQTYARFRVSFDGGLGPVGLATGGEVEDYLVELLASHSCYSVLSTDPNVCNSNGTCTATDTCVCDEHYSGSDCSIHTFSTVDFGDAPDSYGTLSASDGPRHSTVMDLLNPVKYHLGTDIDTDYDGFPSVGADGDDNDNRDDEDGVNFLSDLFIGSGADLSVSAFNNPKLDAWIDYNQNGSFDSLEQIFTNQQLSSGSNLLNITIPSNAIAGNTYARFRVSGTGGLTPTGYAANGEVEDYLVQLVQSGASVTYSWQTGAWNTCSAPCGGGTQSRVVTCVSSTGTTVADINCDSGSQPVNIQPCNTQPCSQGGTCGDGTADGDDPISQQGSGEMCDGTDLRGYTCATMPQAPFISGTLACDQGCLFDTSQCTTSQGEGANTCGNGTIEYFEGEQCDGQNLDNMSCTDFGFAGGNLTCGDFCGFDMSACTGGAPQTCGNNLIEGTETCDDGNLDNGDGCSSFCQFEQGGEDACFAITSSQNCDEDFRCAWDWGQNFCTSDFSACNNYQDEINCGNDNKCFWDPYADASNGKCVEDFGAGYPDSQDDEIYVFPQPFDNTNHALTDGDPYLLDNRPDMMMQYVPRMWSIDMMPLVVGFSEMHDMGPSQASEFIKLYRYDDLSQSWVNLTSNLTFTQSGSEILASTITALDPNAVHRVTVKGVRKQSDSSEFAGQMNACPDGTGGCFTSTFKTGDSLIPDGSYQGGSDDFDGNLTGGCQPGIYFTANWPFEGAENVDPNVMVDLSACDPTLDYSGAVGIFIEDSSGYQIMGNVYGSVASGGLQIEPTMPLTSNQDWGLTLSGVLSSTGGTLPQYTLAFATGDFASGPSTGGGDNPPTGDMTFGSGRLNIGLTDVLPGMPLNVNNQVNLVVTCGEMPDMSSMDDMPTTQPDTFFMDALIPSGQYSVVISGIPTPSDGQAYADNPCYVFMRPDTENYALGYNYEYTGGVNAPTSGPEYSKNTDMSKPMPPNAKYATVEFGDSPNNVVDLTLTVSTLTLGNLSGRVCFDTDPAGSATTCDVRDERVPNVEVKLSTMGATENSTPVWMSVVADNTGTFNFPDLNGGSYMLEVVGTSPEGQGFNYFGSVTVNGNTNNDIVLSMGNTLTLTLDNADACWNPGGSVPVHYDFWPQTWSFDSQPVMGEAYSIDFRDNRDDTYTVTLQGFADGTYDGYLEVPGCKTINAQDLIINFSGDTSETVVLEGGLTLQGKIVTDINDVANTGVANFPFEAYTVFSQSNFDDFGGFIDGNTDGSGNFQLGGVENGEWKFESFMGGAGNQYSFVSGLGSLDSEGNYTVSGSATGMVLVVKQDKRININVNDGVNSVNDAMIDIDCTSGKYVHLGHSNNVWTYLTPSDSCEFSVYAGSGEYEPLTQVVAITAGSSPQDIVLTLSSYNRNLGVYGGYLKADKTSSYPGGIINYRGQVTAGSASDFIGHTVVFSYPSSIANSAVQARSPHGVCTVNSGSVSCTPAQGHTESFFDVFVEIDLPSDFDDSSLLTSLDLNSDPINIDKVFTEIVKLSMNAPTLVDAGGSFTVYGQAYPNATVTLSSINLLGIETILGTTVMEPGSSWYSFADRSIALAGTYTLKVQVIAAGVVESQTQTIVVGGGNVYIDSVTVTGPNGALPTNSATGLPSGQIFEMDEFDVRVCYSDVNPISIITFLGTHYALDSVGGNCYQTTVPSGWTGFGNVNITLLSGNLGTVDYGNIAEILVLIDPSGYIYDTNDENRIEGATATVYQLVAGTSHSSLAEGTVITAIAGADSDTDGEISDSEEGPMTEYAVSKITDCYTISGTLDTDKCRWSSWNAAPSGQVNPQSTDENGKYGWNVPQGWYRVAFQKTGAYSLSYSRDVYVPPAETTLNLNLGAYDVAAPSIASVSPANSTTDVARNVAPVIVFSEPMLASTINTSNVKLLAGSSTVSASVAYDAGSQKATISPTSSLAASTTYTLRITTGVKDDTSNALAATANYTFTTSVAADTTKPTSAADVDTGTYTTTQTVTLSATDETSTGASVTCPSCTIYYTLDGSNPTTSSNVYASALSITSTKTLKFFAVDASGNTEDTITSKTYTLVTTKPAIPTHFAGGGLGTAVSLTWDDTPLARDYKVYRSTDGGSTYAILSAPGNSLYTDLNVTSGQTYSYKVAASNAAGDSGMTAAISLTPSSGAVYTSTTEGQAELPDGTTSMALTDSTVMDLSGNMSSATGGNITVGGTSQSLNSFTSGDLSGVNLSGAQTVGDQSVTVGTSVRLESGTNGTPVSVTNSGFATGQLSIPDGTTIMGPAGWNGQIVPPQNPGSGGNAPTGFQVGSTIVEVGAAGNVLLFDKPVSVIINGIHTNVAYKPAGSTNWVKITAQCAGTYANPTAPTFPGECYITDSGTSKTKIFTYHLTSFANLSANSSSSSSSSSGGGGGGGGSVGFSSLSDYTLSSTVSSTLAKVSNRGLDLSKISDGLPRPVLLQNTGYGIKLEFAQDTKVSNENGTYQGVIEKPDRLPTRETPALPEGFEKIFGAEIATDGAVNFDQPVTLTLPVELLEDTKAEDVKVFFYNEELNRYELVGEGGELSDDQLFISVEIDHLTQFVVMDTKGASLEEIEVLDVAPETIAENIDFASVEFTDTRGHWAYSYINRLQTMGVVKGKQEGIFAPDSTATRAELTKMVLLAFDYEVPETVIESGFSDVDASAWYAPYILKAKTLGLVEGYEDGTFRPNQEVNRVEALKIMLMASGLAIEGGNMDFTDTTEGAWYAPFVAYANMKGIVGGYGDGTFGPGKDITRAEFAKIVIKALDLKE